MIDKKGTVRYVHIGEGNYEETQQKIISLTRRIVRELKKERHSVRRGEGKPKTCGRHISVKKIILLSFWFALCMSFFQPALSGPIHSARLKVDNINRMFLYYIPKHLTQNPMLVFVLHGSGMEAKGMQVLTGSQFDKLADDKKDFIIVYPQGYGRYWNDCRKADTFETSKLKVDDIAFFESMIKYFKENYQHR